MSLPRMHVKIKETLGNIRERVEEPAVYFSIVIFLVAFVSFGLGRLSLLEEKRTPVAITGGFESAAVVSAAAPSKSTGPVAEGGEVFASVNGGKYYYPHCGGLSRIKKENLVSFPSAAVAEAAGYSLAAGCTPR